MKNEQRICQNQDSQNLRNNMIQKISEHDFKIDVISRL